MGTRSAPVYPPEKIAQLSSTMTPPYLCKVCGASFDGMPGLNLHNTRAHGTLKGLNPSTMGGRRAEGAVARKVNGHHHEEPELGGPPPPAASAPSRAGRKQSGRVQWSDDERTLVVEQALEMWQQDPGEGFTHLLFTRATQKILPPDRHRVFTGVESCKDLRERGVRLAKGILAQANKPPTVQVKEVEVEKPLDLDAVLASVPLDRLAGALAAAEMRLKMRQYAVAPILVAPAIASAAAAAPVTTAPAPDGPNPAQRLKEIEATFPQVQVVCFRGHQHEEFVRQFRDHPIVIHKSIDPSAPLNRDLIAPAPAILLVETEKSPVEWRSLIVTVLGEKGAARRDPCFGPSKVFHHAKELAGQWAAKHPKELTEWKVLRAQLR